MADFNRVRPGRLYRYSPVAIDRFHRPQKASDAGRGTGAIRARSTRVTFGFFAFSIAALPTRSSKSAITEELLMCSPRKAMIRDMTQDSDKPKPQASKLGCALLLGKVWGMEEKRAE